MRGKYVVPSVSLTAFSCPHCGTLAPQRWLDLHGDPTKDTPVVWTAERVAKLRESERAEGNKHPPDFWNFFDRLASGQPFAHYSQQGDYVYRRIHNVFCSVCSECDQVAFWLGGQVIWPDSSDAPEPSPDLPMQIVRDFQEARSVLPASPRGAAALLRLCIQKLCGHLLAEEGGGKHIDTDIKTLVTKGLDVRVQRALDIVRVVGNEAVHPGTMDIADDRETAEELFRLVNLIVDIMITQPKHIEEMYGKLPENKRIVIEQRDTPKLAPPKGK